MTSTSRRAPARRTARIVALLGVAAIALAACSSAATPAPSAAVPTMPPVTPSPVPTAAPSQAAAATPDLSQCPKAAADIKPLAKGESKQVTISTTEGDIVTDVSGDLAPIAAGNFVQLAECGYYDGVVFHRIVPDFVIQAGDGQFGRVPIQSKDHMGYGGPGYQFDDEPVVGDYLRGTLAMANAGPNTNGSQFFIVLADLTGANALPKQYTIFGKVTSGMDVVDKIAAAPQTEAGSQQPVDPVEITQMTVGK